MNSVLVDSVILGNKIETLEDHLEKKSDSVVGIENVTSSTLETGYLNLLGKEGCETMKSKGFLMEDNFNLSNQLLLIHSEISEATEFIRLHGDSLEVLQDQSLKKQSGAPNHFPSELADIILRVTALSYFLGIDLDKAVLEKKEFNKTRPYKHGKHPNSNG